MPEGVPYPFSPSKPAALICASVQPFASAVLSARARDAGAARADAAHGAEVAAEGHLDSALRRVDAEVIQHQLGAAQHSSHFFTLYPGTAGRLSSRIRPWDHSASLSSTLHVVHAATAPTRAGTLYTTKCSPNRMSLPYSPCSCP